MINVYTQTNKYDYAISIIRGLAWWLNVGVQVFLCISGYLYSQKEITSVTSFYDKTITKIIINYYILLISMIFIYYFLSIPFSTEQIFRAFFLQPTIPNGTHLWFLPTIVLCYLLTPLLSNIVDYFKDINFLFIVKSFVLVVCIGIFFGIYVQYFNSAAINCYIIGFLLARIKLNPKMYKHLMYVICITTILSNSIQIYFTHLA